MTVTALIPHSATIANADSEFSLLAALLYDSRRIDPIADTLLPEHFSEAFFGRVYGLIIREHGRGQAVNPLTLRPFIEADPAYPAMGGAQFTASMIEHSASALMIDTRQIARHVRELSERRDLVSGLQDAVTLGHDLTADSGAVLDAVETALSCAAERVETVVQISASGAMKALLKGAEQPKRSFRSNVVHSIDELLGGMRPKQLIVGAGRPGMGKTAAALSFARGVATQGHGVLFISLEMSHEELAARIASDMAFDTGPVNYADINSDAPSSRARRAIYDAEQALQEIPLQIVDAGGITIGRIERIVRRWKRRFAAQGKELSLVVVDYLQLVRCDGKKGSRYEEVTEISQRLKAMAKDFGVAVFALAQLSREVEKRADKTPQLSDLRDSGQIEQDADAVLFFYRHEYYLSQAKPDPMDADYSAWEGSMRNCEGKIDFILAKRRNGPTGSATGQFLGAYQAVRG